MREYGLPGRVRADGGSEFNHVNTFMTASNENRHPFIQGPSVHNQRIERLWRDVYTKVLDKYYKLFYHMEDHGILDITNDIRLFVLHHVFLPRINHDLLAWANGHNNHRVRTEHNRTPLQLWFGGNIHNFQTDSTAMNNLFRRDQNDIDRLMEEFSITFDLSEPDDINIVLPRIPMPLTNAQFEHLRANFDPLSPSDKNGIDIYGRILIYVCQCTRSA